MNRIIINDLNVNTVGKLYLTLVLNYRVVMTHTVVKLISGETVFKFYE